MINGSWQRKSTTENTENTENTERYCFLCALCGYKLFREIIISLIFQTQIYMDLHRLMVCFLFISPQRAQCSHRHWNLNFAYFASFAVQYFMIIIFQQPWRSPTPYIQVYHRRVWSIVGSKAGRRIHRDGQGAVCEDGAAPGAMKTNNQLKMNGFSGRPASDVGNVCCFDFDTKI